MDYLPETYVVPLMRIRRVRLLPVPGEVSVQVGDRVEPTEVIAHAETYDKLYVLPVTRRLGVQPGQLSKYLSISKGDAVRKGQAITKRRGLAGKALHSPVEGVVKGGAGGRVLIEANPRSIDLIAHIPGVVTRVIENYGVEIEAQGALIEGVWGAGGEALGVIHRASHDRADVLDDDALDASCHGAILIGGAGLEPGVLDLARELQVRGFVLGSLAPEMISEVSESLIPVIVTEGIGTVPMSEPLFRLLTTHHGREASINARSQSRWDIVRPEVFIPLPADTIPVDTQADGAIPLTIGTQVRLLRAPHLGVVGNVTSLPQLPRRIETGARMRGAEVKVDSMETPIFVPLANLEIIRSQD